MSPTRCCFYHPASWSSGRLASSYGGSNSRPARFALSPAGERAPQLQIYPLMNTGGVSTPVRIPYGRSRRELAYARDFARLAAMRFAALFLLAMGCAGQIIPEPRGPRVVCSGYTAPAGYGYVSNGGCEAVPADPCWGSGSLECRRQAAEREEHNAGVRRTNRLILLGGVVATVVLIGVLSLTSD